MKIMVIGKGHMGQYLSDRIGSTGDLWWHSDMERIDDGTLKAIAPDLIVNTAGKTDLPWCEANPVEALRCNAFAPLKVWRAVKKAFGVSVPFVHISSGCIWNGPYDEAGKPFGPEAPPSPMCFYSQTKVIGELLLKSEAPSGYPLFILRPRQVYSPVPSSRNTIVKLLGYHSLVDTPNSMTSATTILKTIRKLAAASVSGPRTLNVYDLGETTPFRVGCMLAEMGLRHQPARLEKSALDLWHKPRRVDAVLSDPFFEELVQPPLVEEEISRVSRALSPFLERQARDGVK